MTGDVAFNDLEADPALFQGPKGDCQVLFSSWRGLTCTSYGTLLTLSSKAWGSRYELQWPS